MVTAGRARSTVLRSSSLILPPPRGQQLKSRDSRRREASRGCLAWRWEGETAPAAGAVAEGVVLS